MRAATEFGQKKASLWKCFVDCFSCYCCESDAGWRSFGGQQFKDKLKRESPGLVSLSRKGSKKARMEPKESLLILLALALLCCMTRAEEAKRMATMCSNGSLAAATKRS